MYSILIVNGMPRSGKDTAIGFMSEILTRHGVLTSSFSSIDPVRAMLTDRGFDLRGKTEADRALLSSVGDAVERYNSYRTRGCVDVARLFFGANDRGGKSCVLFLHLREPVLIQKLRGFLKEQLPKCVVTTILLQSNRAEAVSSNPSDAGVHDMAYDLTMVNDGTLDELRDGCAWTLQHLGLISGVGYMPPKLKQLASIP